MQRIEVKRGDTFLLNCTARETANGAFTDLSDWTIKSQIRDADGVLIEELTATVIDPLIGSYTLAGADTSLWPADALQMDIEYTDGASRVLSTATIEVRVRPDVTHTP